MVAGLDRRQEFSTDDGGVRRLDCSQGLGTRGPQGVPGGDETVDFPQKGSPDFDEAGPKRRMNSGHLSGAHLVKWGFAPGSPPTMYTGLAAQPRLEIPDETKFVADRNCYGLGLRPVWIW